MSDVFTKAKRSEVMSRIRSSGNRDTELALTRLFRRHGITGWRRNHSIFGKPDFVFLKLRLALFVDGCFWHGCPKHATQPASNRQFWKKKFAKNKARDRFVNQQLRELDWRVLRIWEHELLKKNETRCVKRIQAALSARPTDNATR